MAADLGGNCCADLEERIAELEATTVRKGNRKVSLTVSGHVHEHIMFWDDGGERNAYVMTGPTPTRFRFLGQAKVTSEVTAGFLLEIGAYASLGGGNAAGTVANAGPDATNDDGNAAGPFQVRHSAWWLQHKDLGKVWLGQTSSATDSITEINLANTGHFADGSVSPINIGAFAPRVAGTGANNPLGRTAVLWFGGDVQQQVGEITRTNVIKYETPTIAGFIASAAFGEDDLWDVALRYAGEFSGVKLAAGIGYSEFTDGNIAGATTLNRGCISATAVAGLGSDVKCNQLGLSASVMHVATGLYVKGSYGRRKDDNRKIVFGADAESTDTMWYLQGGIEQKWLSFGKTTVFGEYLENRMGHVVPAATAAALEGTMWGIGLNQSVEAAAMDLYISYRQYSFDFWTSNATGGKAAKGVALEDMTSVSAGAIIKF
jgi:hypothetical protein